MTGESTGRSGALERESTRELFTSLAGRIDEVAPAIAARIRAEVPAYSAVERSTHVCDVRSQILNVINGLATGKPPTADAIAHASDVGRRRAADGVALHEVIEAYHIAYREVWNEALVAALHADAPLTQALVGDVGLLWLWFHRLSALVAEAHAAETLERRESQLALQHQLLDQLLARVPADRVVAEQLGYTVDAEFLVACIGAHSGHKSADRVTAALREAGIVGQCFDDDGAMIVVAHAAASEISELVCSVLPEARIGLGLPRLGLKGARLSLADARAALARAGDRTPIVDFGTDWMMASLMPARERLDQLLRPIAEIARAHPELAETVRAYASSKYSLSVTARSLHIHPNSARYRLDRWKKLTGRDVDSFDGLAASIAALEVMAE